MMPAAPPMPRKITVPDLPAEGSGSYAFFKDEITAAEEKIASKKLEWQTNIDRFLVKHLSATPKEHTVVVPKDFANTEQKSAQLYFQSPEIQGHTKMRGMEDAATVFATAVNEKLGPDGVNADAMMHEMLFDVLCPAGIGVTVIGFETFEQGTKPVQVGEKPAHQPGAVLGLTTPMEPIIEQVPNIIHQRYFWERTSPLYALIPATFHGSDYDKAPWLGYKFELDAEIGKRRWDLTDDEIAGAASEPERLNTQEWTNKARSPKTICGYVLWYYAANYHKEIAHPEIMFRYVMIKGREEPVQHDCPYQRILDTPTGQQIVVGMKGNPVHIFALYYVSDSALPPSESTQIRTLVDEQSKGRSQMIQQRDRAKPMRQVNIGLVHDPAVKEKLQKGEWQDLIITMSNEPIAHEIAHANYPRENFEFNKIVDRDIAEATALSSVQKGLSENTRRTATEVADMRSASETRLSKQQTRLLKWYVRGAEKVGGLMQLFEDDEQFVRIVGTDGIETLQAWDRTKVPMQWWFSARPDSAIKLDANQEFRMALQYYQMVANDPHSNRVEILRWLAKLRNLQPSKVVVAELPEKGPEPPKIALSVKGEDLIPTAPQFPVIQEVLGKVGITISEENVAMGIALAQKQEAMGMAVGAQGAGPISGQPGKQTQHGGPAEQQKPLSKHSANETGKLPGDGKAQAVN